MSKVKAKSKTSAKKVKELSPKTSKEVKQEDVKTNAKSGELIRSDEEKLLLLSNLTSRGMEMSKAKKIVGL